MQPQTLPVRMDSVYRLGGAAMENRSVQMVQTRLMRYAVSKCPDTHRYINTGKALTGMEVNTSEFS